MKELLTELEVEKADVRAVMLHALKNINPAHLLDKRFLDGESLRAFGSRKLRVIS